MTSGLQERIRELYVAKGRRDLFRTELVRVEAELDSRQALAGVAEEAQLLLQKTSEVTRTSIQSRIEVLVTRALRSIFTDRDLSFVVDYKLRAGTPEAHFYIAEGGETFDLDSVGGGVIGVVRLALQVGFLVWCHPPVRRLLILDEALAHLSEDYLGNAGAFLRSLAEDFNLQIIQITHASRLAEAAHKQLRLGILDGKTVVTSV